MKSLFGFSRATPVQPRADVRGSDTPRDFRAIVAWAHEEVVQASFCRLADGEESPRVAIQCRLLGNPLWRRDQKSHDDLLGRIRRAWPEIPEEEVHRVLAHIDARAEAALAGPSRGKDQAELDRARSSWVFGWRFDRHDAEGTR